MSSTAHPGHYVRTEIVDRLRLTVQEAAEAIGVTRQALSAVLNGRASLTPDMAVRFEKAFGVSVETLLTMQTSHDIAKARAGAAKIKVPPFSPKRPPEPQPNLL